MAHIHSIYDTDKHFIIDPITRSISTECKKLYLIQGDHESERYTFEIPRYIEGHDMLMTDAVEIHHTNVSSGDVYTADDLQISPDSEDVVIFSWLISRSSTQETGRLEFSVHFKCFDEDGNEVYAWSTDKFKSVKIGKGTNNSPAVIEEHVDAIEQLRQEIKVSVITDYGDLANIPIKNVASDSENRVALCDLESGVYKLSGAFTPYFGSNRYCWFTEGQLVNVIKKDAGSHLQIFYPIDNTVQFAAIMVDDSAEGGYTYETTNVKLNDLKTAVDSMNPYPTCLYDPVGNEIVWNTTKKKYIHQLWNENVSNYVYITTDEVLPESTKGIIDSEKFATIDVEVLKGDPIDTTNEYHLANGIGTLSGVSYYLPDTLVRVDTTATVGDVIVVKAIDDSGKPTEWKTEKKIGKTGNGLYSEIFNGSNTASGNRSHAEGYNTRASGLESHSEGYLTTASGDIAHAEGINTTASGAASHAEGANTTASNGNSHAEGYSTTASGSSSHAEGGNYDSSGKTLSDLSYTSSNFSAISGTIKVKGPTAYGIQSHAEGTQTLAYGYSSHAEGSGTKAFGDCSHAEGQGSNASGNDSHAESGGFASGNNSHAGDGGVASGFGSFCHGNSGSSASGTNSTVFGCYGVQAKGDRSFATGGYVVCAEGESSFANGKGRVYAQGIASHAEGTDHVYAKGIASHAEGTGTIAGSDYQHVNGKFNIEDTESKYAHIVGNGSSATERSNAHTLDWSGNAWFAGEVFIGGTGQDDEAAKKLVTEETLNTNLDTKISIPSAATVGQTIVVKSVDENGKPTEWEASDLSTQAQSDWNQNDETASDYIKNRPFYSTDYTVLVEKTTIETDVQDGDYWKASDYLVFNNIQHVETDSNITVILDDIEYNNVSVSKEYLGGGAYNTTIGGFPDYTFKIEGTLYTTEPGTHTIYVINKSLPSIKNIPIDYLPTSSALTSVETLIPTCGAVYKEFDMYLSKTNFKEYTPTGDYEPATKKYVDNSKVTDDHINELINTALGVIENGSY